MQEGEICQWRDVDVDGDDGMVRRGMVKDKDHRGFTVDFGCPGHRGDLIPSVKCWWRSQNHDFEVGSSVEVLMRFSADQPWCWFPAKVLAGRCLAYAYVAVELGDKIVHDVVPSERIGCLPETRLPYKCYTDYVVLPADLMTMTKRNDFFQIWNKCTGTIGVAVRGKKLTYLSPGAEFSVQDTDFDDLYSHFSAVMPSSDASDRRTKFGESCSFNDTHGPTNLLANSLKPADGLAASLPCINNAIPSEIVLKMFSFLDVDEQIKCRVVCRAWNDLLKVSRRAEFDLAKYDKDYQLALAVHKVITSSTQVLVLTGSHPDATGNLSPFRVIIEMLTAKSIRVPVLVISHCTIWVDDLLDCSEPCQVKFRAEWAHVCGMLVLEQTTARVVFQAQGEQYCRGVANADERSRRWNQHMKNGYGLELAILKSAVNIPEVKVESVLNILEQPCGKLKYVPDAMRFVKDQLAQICQEGPPMWRDRVFKMLQKWQPGDSRFYSASDWTQDHLACIPTESLRKLTVLALRYQLGERQRDLDDDDSAQGNCPGQASDFYDYPEDYDEYD